MSQLPPVPATRAAPPKPSIKEALRQCRNQLQALWELADENKPHQVAAMVQANAGHLIAQADEALS